MKTINPLFGQVSEAIELRRPELAAAIVSRGFLRHPELGQRLGKAGRDQYLQDAGCHLSHLAAAIAADQVALFRDYIGWAKVMLGHRGIPETDLAALLGCMKETLCSELPPEVSWLACDYLDIALEQLPQMPGELPSFLDDDHPLAPLAADYLHALLRGDRHLASRLILDATQREISVRSLYRHVFQRTQYEIGRLWQLNAISVAQEHYCTAATQVIMSQLYPCIFGAKKTGGTLVATCVSGELHEIGARMLADYFEMDGWRTYYVGANLPASSVVQTLVQNQATVLGISATITYHVRAVEALIATVRRAPECHGLVILVGGHPFKLDPHLWEKIGADGFAADAEDAVVLARRLTSLPLAA